jgi:hypothetical protein
MIPARIHLLLIRPNRANLALPTALSPVFCSQESGYDHLHTIQASTRLCDARKKLDTNNIFYSQHVTEAPGSQRNFLVVDSKTETSEIERAFQSFTQERKDIAVLLINQHVRIALLPCTRHM